MKKKKIKNCLDKLNIYTTNAPFLYLLKTSEGLWFIEVFKGFRNEQLG